jgi:hypothetical protein
LQQSCTLSNSQYIDSRTESRGEANETADLIFRKLRVMHVLDHKSTMNQHTDSVEL